MKLRKSILVKSIPSLLLGCFLLLGMLWGCEDFVDVDLPNNQLTGEVVFQNPSTVDAALANIYAELRDESPFKGNIDGMSYLLGHYADEFDLHNPSLSNVGYFYENNLLATDTNVDNWWTASYTLIYAINRIIEGVGASDTLLDTDKDRFLGEAHFLRALLHFYLYQLYGEIPYVESSDYTVNTNIQRNEIDHVHQRMVDDLKRAKDLLTMETGNTLRPNYWVASALLARTYLYQGQWELAQTEAVDLIDHGGYALALDVGEVFLGDSPETLWHLGPISDGINTREAFTFVFETTPPPNSALSPFLIADFEENDARFNAWVGSVSDGEDTWYYPYKYKETAPTDRTEEYSILFRLAEVYLIAAEASIQLDRLSEGLYYLNAIRSRAGLVPLAGGDKNSLLSAVEQERRIELFSEQGHRFFDLKRTGRASGVLGPIKDNWEATDALLPIPESELLLNPNLSPQNEGY
ncbi:RagB/SusD family nutrient uptake outer membrane protein [Flagellimonas halotolerans]|uniref:RagB/SusD family nutrient uptake outer membrane protein n=1 Tax=Flagellimonas halotolerans TaxID=3112164 RepID=A0ABU6IRJ1_9FLAO|nr:MULTISPECIES: RagB/SusD family nutrient uptake outer membrane protein [unclassified Allomuricauda]MEC3965798.1 RagB/SusD family nutrient uptake outer membrane protein [Muricauda sp. SYSU M86414]MEC4265736.1 RagB/SusD family nutrient uptake outer membrane protein [Muricauda sp. SYSU M84420]